MSGIRVSDDSIYSARKRFILVVSIVASVVCAEFGLLLLWDKVYDVYHFSFWFCNACEQLLHRFSVHVSMKNWKVKVSSSFSNSTKLIESFSARSRTLHPLEAPGADTGANYHEFGISAACCSLMQYHKQFTGVRVKSRKGLFRCSSNFLWYLDRTETIAIYAIISR